MFPVKEKRSSSLKGAIFGYFLVLKVDVSFRKNFLVYSKHCCF